ncbi:MAG: HD domain-containing phosphohydrolase [bacterium]
MECRGNILVVDDEIGPRESIRMIMKPYHDIKTAQSGEEALQKMLTESFDLVTLDLNMPDMHGIEVLKRIKEKSRDVEVVIITGYGSLETAQQAIRYGAFDYITKPFNIVDFVSVVNKAIHKLRLRVRMGQVIADLQDKDMTGRMNIMQGGGSPKGLAAPLGDAWSNDKDLSLMDFIKVLSSTLEAKNSNMHHHSERVDHYSMVIARAMDLSEKEQEYLTIAAFLHDIGKVGISNEILNKAGALTQDEWAEIRKHPRSGVDILKPLCLPQEVLHIILHHHESFDGKGYPDGLRGEEIPLSARIIRIIDSYDAMISNRPYRQALSLDWVIRELRSCAGTQFDPRIVEIFVDILTRQESCNLVGSS